MANTRWISIEAASARICEQWLELGTHFSIVKDSEKCYSAILLSDMYRNELNLAYFLFLKPILLEIQRTNKSFESNDADLTNLLQVSLNAK